MTSDFISLYCILKRMTPEGKVQIKQRLINNKTMEKLKAALEEMTRDPISSKQTNVANEAYLKKKKFDSSL